jgi:hypothetical protein
MLALLNRYFSCHPTVAYRCLALTMKVPLPWAVQIESFSQQAGAICQHLLDPHSSRGISMELEPAGGDRG